MPCNWNFCKKFFTAPSSKNIIATPRIVTIEYLSWHSFLYYISMFWNNKALHFFMFFFRFRLKNLYSLHPPVVTTICYLRWWRLYFPIERVNKCESCLFLSQSWFHKTYIKLFLNPQAKLPNFSKILLRRLVGLNLCFVLFKFNLGM